MVTHMDEHTDTTTATPVLMVTPLAVTKIKDLLTTRNLEGYALRVFVSGGGCSGLQYGMAFESQADETDTRVEADGINLLVDSISLPYLQARRSTSWKT
jgi:iron-sulfur cluster insertion protein